VLARVAGEITTGDYNEKTLRQGLVKKLVKASLKAMKHKGIDRIKT
jgi:hypothetical protein